MNPESKEETLHPNTLNPKLFVFFLFSCVDGLSHESRYLKFFHGPSGLICVYTRWGVY